MDRMMKIAAIGTGLTLLLMIVVLGPIMAAFIVAAFAFVVMFSLLVVEGVRAFEQWRLSHPWALPWHRKVH